MVMRWPPSRRGNLALILKVGSRRLPPSCHERPVDGNRPTSRMSAFDPKRTFRTTAAISTAADYHIVTTVFRTGQRDDNGAEYQFWNWFAGDQQRGRHTRL